jgi:regulator of sigma E protease
VIVHELGHFLFARLFNVKAEAFSIGFGPILWKKLIGETEWRFSAIPFGGYVKLLGEDPTQELSEEDKPRALNRQVGWKRFFIYFGGPLFNFLWAILVYMAILAMGEPQMLSQIGRVLPNSPASLAGLQSGDIIKSVNGTSVRTFEDLMKRIDEYPETKIQFEVERKDLINTNPQTLSLEVTSSKEEGFSEYGERKHVGHIEGVVPNARGNLIGVSNLDSVVGKLGLRSGDQITLLNQTPIDNYETLEKLYANIPVSGTFTLTFISKNNPKPIVSSFLKTSQVSLGELIGLYSSELFVDKTVDQSPAAVAGIRFGDRLISINDQTVTSFYELRKLVQRSGEDQNGLYKGKVKMTVEREGKIISEVLAPTATITRDALLNKEVQYTVGILPILSYAAPLTVTERILNPLTLLVKGTERMLDFSYKNLISIKKMFSGSVSVSTLGGPILIGKIAGDSLSRGLIAFLSTMAILSIGLGVLNLLPVPVLDGGHILLLIVETLRGKPLSLKQMQFVQQIGLSLILLLMFVVIKNDLTRLPFFN